MILRLTLTGFFIAAALIAQAPTGLTALPSSAYEHIYLHVQHLGAMDTANAARGQFSNLSAYYTRLANLSPQQATALQTVSAKAAGELAALDQQAQALIAQWRTQVKAVKPGQKLPPVPSQLATLQTSRKAVLDSYHTQLIQQLGQAAFSRLDQALLAKYKVGVKSVAGH